MSEKPEPVDKWTSGDTIAVIDTVVGGPQQTTLSFSVWDGTWRARYMFIENISPAAQHQLAEAKKGGNPMFRYQDWNLDDYGLPTNEVPLNAPRRVDKLAGKPFSWARLRNVNSGTIIQVSVVVDTADQRQVLVPLSLQTYTTAKRNLPAFREYGTLKYMGREKM